MQVVFTMKTPTRRSWTKCEMLVTSQNNLINVMQYRAHCSCVLWDTTDVSEWEIVHLKFCHRLQTLMSCWTGCSHCLFHIMKVKVTLAVKLQTNTIKVSVMNVYCISFLKPYDNQRLTLIHWWSSSLVCMACFVLFICTVHCE